MRTRASVAVSNRYLTRRRAWLASAAVACVFGGSAASAQVAQDPRTFVLVPRISVQGLYTDNSDLTSAARKSEFIARGEIGLDARINSVRTDALLDVSATYDHYSSTKSKSGVSWQGVGSGIFTIVDKLLTLEVNGASVNDNLSVSGNSAIDRSGVSGRTRLTTVGGGPRLTSNLDDFADLNAVARVSYVAYSSADGSPAVAVPRDATIMDVGVGADTGERFSNFQFTAITQYLESSDDFQLRNAIGSGYLRVAPNLRLIARGGYEDISQPLIADIQSPIWSAGVELSLGTKSKISVEGGRRYERNVWAANAHIQLLERLLFTAEYFEALQTSQISLTSSFFDFTESARDLPAQFVQKNFSVTGNLIDETTFSKNASMNLIYIWPTQRVDVGIRWADNYLFGLNTNDRTIEIDSRYSRDIRQDLNLSIGARYAKTYESQIFGKRRSYGVNGAVTYKINPTADVRLGYARMYERSLLPGAQSVTENAGFLALEKRFQ